MSQRLTFFDVPLFQTILYFHLRKKERKKEGEKKKRKKESMKLCKNYFVGEDTIEIFTWFSFFKSQSFMLYDVLASRHFLRTTWERFLTASILRHSTE